MGRMATQYSRPIIRLSPALIEACLRYAWPGNLRELENFVKRYLVMGDEATAIAELRANGQHNQIAVDASSGPTLRRESVPAVAGGQGARGKGSLRALKDETEVNAISQALEATRWNRKQAARLLNISYRGMLYKIHHHGITRPSENVPPPSRDRKTV
jgi:two-component system response regulator AtoC